MGALGGLNAVQGVEIGAGFAVVERRGSENNDPIRAGGYQGNSHGGLIGGITTGMPLVFRVGFKPTSTIAKPQQSVRKDLERDRLQPAQRAARSLRGRARRRDAGIAPRHRADERRPDARRRAGDASALPAFPAGRRNMNAATSSVPWLFAMKGHPATGKSAVAHALAQRLHIPLIDKDDIKDVVLGLPNANDLAYAAMWQIAGCRN
jgi:hypothetical protein